MHLALEQLPATVKRLYLAFSAGIDSCVLLHHLVSHQNRFSLVLWHINHGLQSNADQMQQLAMDLAHKYNLEIRVDKLDLKPSAGNLEAVARHARYDLFSSQLTAEDALLTAHHMNDQAETLMLNLMRGSGASGLRGIAELKPLGKGLLFRPLLDTQREEIEQYANLHNLQWVDDPSNQSLKFDRNYLRHQVMPVIEKRWSTAVQQLHRVSEWQKEQHQLLQELAEMDYMRVHKENRFSRYNCVAIPELLTLSVARQKNLIRYWIKSYAKPQIGFRKLQQLLQQIEENPESSSLIEGEGYSLRIYQKLIFLVDALPLKDIKSKYLLSEESPVHIEVLAIRQTRQSILEYLKLSDKGQKLALVFRQPDASMQSGNSHRLKRLFQKNKVPPWLRPYMPQIYVDDQLKDLLL